MAGVSTEELKSRVSIAEIVSGYVSLRKRGRSHIGLCPFHDDKNPSLHVSDEKGMFYCFSCKTGGDVFAFLEKIKGCSFTEALHEVAERAGVKIESRASSGRGFENDALLAVNAAVGGFFRETLNNGSPESRRALSYLGRRGISPEMAELFSIGYAPQSGGAIAEFLSGGGFSLKRAAALGLVSPPDGSGACFGRFRGRIMFPIFTPDGKTAGFGGRLVAEGARGPKYLNSPESPVYRKRESLYGLDKTRGEMRRRGTAVLVEGYTDLLSVYSAGIKNAAASLGTSLTGRQVAILRGYADDFVILYDGDRAGADASLAAGKVFMESGVVPRVARIPGGLDPDRFARREGGAEALAALVDGAPPLTEVLMDGTARAVAGKKISQTVAAKKLMEIVPVLGNSPEVGPYIREVSRRFGFTESALYSTVSAAGGGRRTKPEEAAEPEPGAGPAEMMLLRIALKFPDAAGFLSGEEVMKHLPDGEVKNAISSLSASGAVPSAPADGLVYRAHFTLDAIDFIDRGNMRTEIEKCLARLKLDSVGRELKSVRERLRAVEGGGETGGERDLVKLYRDLLERRKAVMEGMS